MNQEVGTKLSLTEYTKGIYWTHMHTNADHVRIYKKHKLSTLIEKKEK